jgi:acyl-CoA thioesterase I
MVLMCLALLACSRGSSSPAPPPLQPTPTPAPTRQAAFGAAARASPSAASSASATTNVLTYTAIGASDTVGVGATDPPREGWVPRLAGLLGPETTRVHNLGVSGTLIHSALQEQLPAAVKDRPNLVTVWLAVNDMNAKVPLESYTADLDQMLSTLAEQTRSAVLVANVPDLTLVPAYRDVDKTMLRAEVQRWNAAIADAIKRHKAYPVDLFAEYAELAARPELLSDDGFHPSSAGYVRIAELFYAVARSALR